ncbi:MAG: hypothetical protein LIP28_03210 [Deltaproteobacteria bacterium]|nr:hypothetical protein [Deltaproteobacteria bacterium]
MRTYTITRGQLFMSAYPRGCLLILLVLLFLAGLNVYSLANAYGPHWLMDHFGFWLREFLIAAWPLYCLFAIFSFLLYRASGRQKVIGIPIRYGFDEAGVHFDNFYGTSFCKWTLFISWKETKKFILLNDGARRILWPKSLWSEEELAAQRALMNGNISPKRANEP